MKKITKIGLSLVTVGMIMTGCSKTAVSMTPIEKEEHLKSEIFKTKIFEKRVTDSKMILPKNINANTYDFSKEIKNILEKRNISIYEIFRIKKLENSYEIILGTKGIKGLHKFNINYKVNSNNTIELSLSNKVNYRDGSTSEKEKVFNFYKDTIEQTFMSLTNIYYKLESYDISDEFNTSLKYNIAKDSLLSIVDKDAEQYLSNYYKGTYINSEINPEFENEKGISFINYDIPEGKVYYISYKNKYGYKLPIYLNIKTREIVSGTNVKYTATMLKANNTKTGNTVTQEDEKNIKNLIKKVFK